MYSVSVSVYAILLVDWIENSIVLFLRIGMNTILLSKNPAILFVAKSKLKSESTTQYDRIWYWKLEKYILFYHLMKWTLGKSKWKKKKVCKCKSLNLYAKPVSIYSPSQLHIPVLVFTG